jgi:hypothetical protein
MSATQTLKKPICSQFLKLNSWRLHLNPCRSQVWWYTPTIPALGWVRQKDHKLEASLDYLVRSFLKKKKKKTTEINKSM